MNRFTTNADRRIADLEKKVQALEALASGRNYGSRGNNPIGWRVPWVRYSLNLTDTGSNQTFYLEPSLFLNGWNGSEVDTLVHRMHDAGNNGRRGFQIVGRGTWLMYLWVNFNYDVLESSHPSYNRHTGHLWPEYQALFLTNLGRNEQHNHTVWSMPFTGFGGTFSKTMLYQWPFNVRGDVTPAAPQELYLRFLSPQQTIRNGSTSLITKTPTDARVLFIRLDSEAVRNIEMLLPGDGVEEEEPPPPPLPTPPPPDPIPDPEENFPGGPPPP